MNEQNQIAKRPTAQVASGKPSALKVMAARLSVDEDKMLTTLKSTVFAKATNEEMLALVVVANAYDLNPFLKEIYAFPAKGGGIIPIVSVDGWNKMLIRHPDFDGIEFEMIDKEDGTPYSCTATIHVKGRSKPVKITEYLDECFRKTDAWENMPRRMLRNRTLCQASRVAFGFSGVKDPDEAADIIEVNASQPPPKLVQIAGPKADVSEEVPQDRISPAADSPQSQLCKLVEDAGFTFQDFLTWGEQSGNLPDATSIPEWQAVPKDVASRLLKAKTGLLTGLKSAKGGQ